MKKIILGLGLALGLLTGSALAASSGSGGFAILAPAVDNTVIGNVTGVTGTPVAVDIGTALGHNAAGNRTALGLPLGTSGATVPLLSTANTWSLAQTFTA
ncbi:MAG TPA: hypothetical protein VNH17_03000, partial [Streptosporangiaceae bacterium]|nr:hypothetical protein [Streptosporangiaceae bacterium]